jgi:acyl carrier protein
MRTELQPSTPSEYGMPVDETSIRNVIKEYLSSYGHIRAEEIDDTANVFEAAYLDSIEIVTFVGQLETECQIQMDNEYFFDPRFVCVDGLVQIVMEIKAASSSRCEVAF